jgi:hypothetical protein
VQRGSCHHPHLAGSRKQAKPTSPATAAGPKRIDAQDRRAASRNVLELQHDQGRRPSNRLENRRAARGGSSRPHRDPAREEERGPAAVRQPGLARRPPPAAAREGGCGGEGGPGGADLGHHPSCLGEATRGSGVGILTLR